jgi:hypothetical protein
MTGPLPHPLPRPRSAPAAPAFTSVVAPAPQPAPAPRRRLSLRPLAQVDRISLFEREVRERLSRAALEVIFSQAGIMSEGQRAARGGREVFHGSTMLTIELSTVAPAVRDVCDARAAQRLCALLATDATAATRIKSIAAAEAERLCRTRPRSLGAEIKVRARGTTVYVDVDVEASF